MVVRLVFFLFSINLSLAIICQDFILAEGIVTSIDGEHLAFSHIKLSTSNIGTITNSQGRFFLKIPSDNCDGSLIISHIGYFDYFHDLSCKAISISIQLKPSILQLDEVIVASLSPEGVIKKVINNLQNNYSKDSINYTIFSRREEKNIDGSPSSLREYVFNMYHGKNNKPQFFLQKARGKGFDKFGKKRTKDARVIDVQLAGIFLMLRYVPNFLKKSKMGKYHYSYSENQLDGFYSIDIKGIKKTEYLNEGKIIVDKSGFGISYLEKKYLDAEWNDLAVKNRVIKVFYDLIEGKWFFSHSVKTQKTIYKKEKSSINSRALFTRTQFSSIKNFTNKEDIGFTAKKLDTLLESFTPSSEYWENYNFVPADSIFQIDR